MYNGSRLPEQTSQPLQVVTWGTLWLQVCYSHCHRYSQCCYGQAHLFLYHLLPNMLLVLVEKFDSLSLSLSLSLSPSLCLPPPPPLFFSPFLPPSPVSYHPLCLGLLCLLLKYRTSKVLRPLINLYSRADLPNVFRHKNSNQLHQIHMLQYSAWVPS